MNKDRFTLETIIYIIVGLIFLAIFIIYYSAAFPTASIRMDVTRDEAQKIAEDFLKEQGYDLSDYRKATIFDVNDIGAVFIQQTQGMEKANEIIKEKIPIWYWKCRWFRSGEKEEFQIYVSPSGKITMFTHIIGEDEPGSVISQKEARQIVSDFLNHIIGLNLLNYEQIGSSTEKLENRTDHYFEWEDKELRILESGKKSELGKGYIRISACVQGGKIGGFHHYFKTPETFDRYYKKIQSQRTLLTIISIILSALIGVFAIVIFIIKFKQNTIHWRFGLAFGVLVAILLLIASINNLPNINSNYSTNMEYSIYLGIMIAIIVLMGVIYCAFILFTGASGYALSQELYPGSVRTLKNLIKKQVFTRSFFFSSLRGYALSFFMLGYVTLFYIIGQRHLDIFVPAKGPYSNLLGTYLPWLIPLSISLLAAVSEEFVFRLFSITFLKRYLKWTPIAIIIPAMIWAFLHTTYPVYPVYIRGIELTIVGIIFGLFFIRFGILSCLIAHYVYDAVLFGLPLLKSANIYYVISGIIVCLLAAAPWIFGIPGLFQKTSAKKTEGI